MLEGMEEKWSTEGGIESRTPLLPVNGRHHRGAAQLATEKGQEHKEAMHKLGGEEGGNRVVVKLLLPRPYFDGAGALHASQQQRQD